MVPSNSKTNKTTQTQIFARDLAWNVSTSNHANRNVNWLLGQKIASGHVHHFESTFRIFGAPGDLARPEIWRGRRFWPARFCIQPIIKTPYTNPEIWRGRRSSPVTPARRGIVLREFQIQKWNFYLFNNVIIILVVNVYQYNILISVVCQTSSF